MLGRFWKVSSFSLAAAKPKAVSLLGLSPFISEGFTAFKKDTIVYFYHIRYDLISLFLSKIVNLVLVSEGVYLLLLF